VARQNFAPASCRPFDPVPSRTRSSTRAVSGGAEHTAGTSQAKTRSRCPLAVAHPSSLYAVTNEKRQRQDLNRQAKVEQLKSVENKASATAKRNRILTLIAAVVGVIALILLASKCSGSGDTAADTTLAEDTIAPATTLAPNPKLADKPVITVPKTPKPTKLEVKDLVVGTGPEIAAGDDVVMQYAGSSWSTGQEFDSSWSRGKTPFPVQNVGQAGVIAGWNQGLIGMKQGGRRQIIIPPDLGYGAAGSPPKIDPNETLIFVVDAEQVTKNAAAPAAPATTLVAATVPKATAAAAPTKAPTATPTTLKAQ
jgi:peptidylprolyl isomerase